MNSPLSHNRSARSPRLVRSVLAATLLLCTAHMANAQSNSRSMDATGSSYVGLSGGPSDFSRINSGNGLFPRETLNTAYSLTFGNYFMSPNMGAQVGYTNFGNVSRGGGTSKAEGINISLIGKLPVGQSVNLLGKVGTTYGHTEVSAQPPSGMSQGSESGFDWSYGVGAELVFNPQWSGVLQYDEHYMKFSGSDSDRVSTTTIGVRLHF